MTAFAFLRRSQRWALQAARHTSLQGIHYGAQFAALLIIVVGALGAITGQLAAFSRLLPILLIISFVVLNVGLKRPVARNWDAFTAIGVLIILCFGLYVFAFHHHYVNAGRDDGVYPASAAFVSKHDSLVAVDRSAGTFLTFEPVEGQETGPTFSRPYVLFLAMWYEWFGTRGVAAGDAVLVVAGLLSFFLCSRNAFGSTFAVAALLLLVTLGPVTFHARKSFSESLLFCLFWGCVAEITSGGRPNWRSAFAPAAALLIVWVRPEGVLYTFSLATTVILANWRVVRRVYASRAGKVVFILAGLLGGLGVLVALLRAARTSLTLRSFVDIVVLNTQNIRGRSPNSFVGYVWEFNWGIFSSYVLLPLLVAASFGAAFVRSRRVALVALCCAPTALFLLHPLISPDQPFFMRRFWPVFLPLMAFLAAGFLSKLAGLSPRVGLKGLSAFCVGFLCLVPLPYTASILDVRDQESARASAEAVALQIRALGFDQVILDGGLTGGYAPFLYFEEGMGTFYLPQVDPFGHRFPAKSPLTPANLVDYTDLDEKKTALLSERRDPNRTFFQDADLEFLQEVRWTSSSLGTTCDVLLLITRATPQGFDFEAIREKCFVNPSTDSITKETTTYLFRIVPHNDAETAGGDDA